MRTLGGSVIPKVLLGLALVPSLAFGQDASRASASTPEIVATGSAQVSMRPDRASITVSVVVRDASASDAGRVNAERMAAVLASLRRLGVPDSAMATTGFSIEVQEPPYDAPVRPIDEPTVYVARNSVTISLTDLDAIGRIVDTTLVAGASEIGGISYGSSQSSAGRRRAIALAVQEARADAEAAAEAAGGRLGELVELTLTPAYRLRGAAAASLYQSSAYGEVSILVPSDVSESATAVMRFSFVPRR
jgi:uncharacterized protein